MKCKQCSTQYTPHRFKGDVAGDQLQEHCLQCSLKLMRTARKYNMDTMFTRMKNKPELPEGTRKERQLTMQAHKDRIRKNAYLMRMAEKQIELISYEINHT
jgi:hypothetical protein